MPQIASLRQPMDKERPSLHQTSGTKWQKDSIHEEPRVGIPLSNGCPFTALYDRGPIALAIAYAATTKKMAVINTVTNKIKDI